MSLVGRQVHLEALAGDWPTPDGGSFVAWLRGAEGVGKSALAAEVARRSGLRQVVVDLFPDHAETPLSGVEDLAALLGDENESATAHDLLRTLEKAGEVCVVIEDAQWLDEESQRILWRVLRRSFRLPVWWIITSTDTETFLLDGLGLLLRQPSRGRLIQVEPLSLPQVSEFLRSELRLPVEGAALERAHAVTGGYPSLLVSLVDQVRLSGHSAGPLDALSALSVRAHARDGVLRVHTDGVLANATPPVRAALVALALAGELTARELTRVAHHQGLDEAGLGELSATRLVDRTPTGIRIRHQPSRQAILDRAGGAEVAAAQVALAEALDGLPALTHRVAAAATADPQQRAEVAWEVITQLAAAYANRDFPLGFRLARLGVRLDPSLAVEMVLAALRAGAPGLLEKIGAEIEDLEPSMTRSVGLAVVDLERGDYTEGVARLLRLRPEPIADSRELMSYTHGIALAAIQSLIHAIPLDPRPFANLTAVLRKRASVEPEAAYVAELEVMACGHEIMMPTLDAGAPPSSGIAKLEALVPQIDADPLKQLVLGPHLLGTLGLFQSWRGEVGAARRGMTEAAQRVMPMLRVQLELTRAVIAFVAGDWDTAHALADRQLSYSLDGLQRSYWQQSFAVAALVPACRGETAVADQYLGWLDEGRVEILADAYHRITSAWRLIAIEGDGAGAAALLDEVWEVGMAVTTNAVLTGVLRVRGHVAAGNVAAARAARAQLAAQDYEQHALAYALAHADAVLAGAAGDHGTEAIRFAEAAQHLAAQGAADPASAFRLYAAVLAEDWARSPGAGGTPACGELLAEAVAVLDACGAAAWRDRLAALVPQEERSAEAEQTTPTATLLGALTSREREIALLVGQGMTNRQIAEGLFVTVRTAEYHVHNVLTKLGLGSRVELRRRLEQGAPQVPGTSVTTNESVPLV